MQSIIIQVTIDTIGTLLFIVLTKRSFRDTYMGKQP